MENQEKKLKTPFDIMMERLGIRNNHSEGMKKLIEFNERFRKKLEEIKAKKNKGI